MFVAYDGDPLDIGFNASYLLEVLRYMPSDEVKKSSSQESGRLEEIRQKRPRRPVRWPSTLPHPPLALAASRWTKRWKSVFGILPALLFSKTQLHGKLQIRHLALVARSSSGPVFSGGAALRTRKAA